MAHTRGNPAAAPGRTPQRPQKLRRATPRRAQQPAFLVAKEKHCGDPAIPIGNICLPRTLLSPAPCADNRCNAIPLFYAGGCYGMKLRGLRDGRGMRSQERCMYLAVLLLLTAGGTRAGKGWRPAIPYLGKHKGRGGEVGNVGTVADAGQQARCSDGT